MSKIIEAPQIAKEHGMTRLVFEDDFDSLDTIDVDNTGKEGYKWYVSRAYEAPPLEKDDYKVENSVLTLVEKHPRYNYGLCTYNAREDHGFAWHKGVLELRIRIPDPTKRNKEAGEKGIPAIWSFSPSKLTDESIDFVEADWLEYWGNGYWTLTLHHMKRAVKCGPHVFWVHNNNHRAPKSLDDREWHTLTYYWDDGIIEGYVDGELAVSTTYGPRGLDPKVPYYHECEPSGDEYAPLEREPEALIISGSFWKPLEIDWVRIWQR